MFNIVETNGSKAVVPLLKEVSKAAFTDLSQHQALILWYLFMTVVVFYPWQC